jgi:hypothetical protein
VDPVPAFYLNADLDNDPDPGSQINTDTGGSGSKSWSAFELFQSQTVEILHGKYTQNR